MKQKTFGKRGLATSTRDSSPKGTTSSIPSDTPKPRLFHQSESTFAEAQPPTSASGFYIPDREPETQSALSGAAKTGYETLVGLMTLFGLVAVGLSMCQPSDADRERSAQRSAQNREKGFHCLSAWDGSHVGFVDSVKNALRDPNSFEHIKTVITPESDGQHIVMMDYRARNGFGGMNVGVAMGVVSNVNCRLLGWENLQ